MTNRWVNLANRDDPDYLQYRVLTHRTIILSALLIVMVGIAMVTWLLIAFGHGSVADQNRLEAIRTAGTIVIGTGGAAALLLTARRQRSTELALKHQELVASATEYDAIERRVTELYTKAADQLGSDKAPVRLAGLYALERLAQGNEAHRQTVVDVLCAYLRMPYEPPPGYPRSNEHGGVEDETTAIDAGNIAGSIQQTRSPRTAHERSWVEERQVRLAAQRILIDHLHPHLANDANPKFWSEIDVDFTGAVLIGFNMTGCQARTAQFEDATFVGTTRFAGANFVDGVFFVRATFDGDVAFDELTVTGGAHFGGAKFLGETSFSGAGFVGEAHFGLAQFEGHAHFVQVNFNGSTEFEQVQFAGHAAFMEASFKGDAQFNGTEFDEYALFDGAKFLADASFAGVRFGGLVQFDGAEFSAGTPQDLADVIRDE